MTGRKYFFLLLFFDIVLLIANCATAIAAPADVSQLDGDAPISWLVKSVCTDRRDLVLPVDPYGGCPAGARIRKIRSGDPLPYHNLEQIGYQQRDAFPVDDPLGDKTWIVATFDYRPFDQFNLFNGTDGYDVFILHNGWAAIANTSDGGGYGQTFYGSNCTIGGGWILFPATGFLQNGVATVPIADVYWEQGGQSYPGACPSHYSTDTQTNWEFHRGFRFGGVNGGQTKTMDTVISYHGFRPGAKFLRHGHLEVFYFTREYGITRWEVWVPQEQNATRTTECNVPATMTYQAVIFVVQNCHDWSNVVPASVAKLPVWPIPNINLLKKPHFDDAAAAVWHSAGNSPAGDPLKWSERNSTAPPDTRTSSLGVRYLRLECGAGSGDHCGGELTEAMYQDVPLNKFAKGGGTYAFGVDTRTETGHGEITVAIQQIDGAGKVISTDGIVSAGVLPDNGEVGRQSREEFSSVYLSSGFVANIVTIKFRPNTSKIRFLVAPQSPQAFDVLDAWLAPWPASRRFGLLP